MNLPVLVAGNDEAVVDDPAQYIVAGPGYLALVGQEDPGLREDPLYLQVKDAGLVVYLREELALLIEGTFGFLQNFVNFLFPSFPYHCYYSSSACLRL